jgi:choline dehydrogenase-like flavoprotein
MFIDSRTLDDGKKFERQVCIIGAGAAGLTLATSLGRAGIEVDLVESGGLKIEVGTQKLTTARFIRDGAMRDIATQRLRYFGGTTGHWGGNCHPLDPFEFEPHDWIPDSGWPITRKDLDPFYDRARETLRLPHDSYQYDPVGLGIDDRPTFIGQDGADTFEMVQWRRTQPEPLRFSKQFGEEIAKSAAVRCFLNANATEIVPNKTGDRIESLRVATLSGKKLEFRARQYVLCTGAIENARLLLMSNSVVSAGVGNQKDMVGRCFSEHGFRAGKLMIVGREMPRLFQEEYFTKVEPDKDGRGDRVGYSTTPAFREKHQSLGFAAILNPTWKYSRPYALAKWSVKAVAELEAAGGGKLQIAKGKLRTRTMQISFLPEQSPNRDSRIRLAEEKDALGRPMAWVDMKAKEIDLRSRLEGIKKFSIALLRSGAGRVELTNQDDTQWMIGIGGHQTGSLRMSDDPTRGATDRNAKIHGVENLFVGSSALFPTAGWQHPTLTIVALTLRLSEHLKKQHKGPS